MEGGGVSTQIGEQLGRAQRRVHGPAAIWDRDGGHGNLPVGGDRNSPVMATGSPHGWPSDLPTTTVVS
jgi:hypothetical protein